jgi:hypothetical protein
MPATSLPATNAKRLRKGAKATKQSILSLLGAMDCFASLAMTESKRSPDERSDIRGPYA